MATTVADRALLDTNVLLAATDERRAGHAEANAILRTWPAIYTSSQILREYLVVSTRPLAQNGFGLAPADAIGNLQEFSARLTTLADDAGVHDRLLRLVDATGCSGKRIHDANIVATGLAHGVDLVVTANLADFERFENHIRVSPLV